MSRSGSELLESVLFTYSPHICSDGVVTLLTTGAINLHHVYLSGEKSYKQWRGRERVELGDILFATFGTI